MRIDLVISLRLTLNLKTLGMSPLTYKFGQDLNFYPM